MQGTGKSTNQSPTAYTPSICALRGESDCMPSFRSMVLELEKIEEQGFITVDGKDLPLHIKVGIIGDKSFMWKVSTRGHACSSGLGDSPSNGVRKCDLSFVKEELQVREMSKIGTSHELRARLTSRLQLEREYFGLEAAARDDRFNVEHWGVLQDPSRHLLDLLHLPMPTNEKMLHMLKLKALERRGGKTSEGKKVLQELDNICSS